MSVDKRMLLANKLEANTAAHAAPTPKRSMLTVCETFLVEALNLTVIISNITTIGIYYYYWYNCYGYTSYFP